MTIFDPANWAHQLARQLQIKPSHARNLERLGILPDKSVRNESLRFCFDMDCIKAIERCRPYFDTPLQPFIDNLRALSALLVNVSNEAPSSKALVEFRQFSFGTDANGCYPITRFRMPWRGHRVPVSFAQLDAAGYREFAALWHGPGGDPYGSVPIGGEVPLGPFQWVYASNTWPQLRSARSAFIARLADVLEVL